MELIYKIKKPETITRFMHENNIPLKLVQIENGISQIMINHDLKTKNDTIKKGDTLRIMILDEQIDKTIVKQNIPLNILYEDEYVLIVNKPADMQIMVSKAHPEGTLANGINYYYEKNKINSKIYLVNRLDKETSGLVMIAKNRFIKFLFSEKTDSTINREYYAILDGILDAKKNCIDLPINRVDGSIKREVVLNGEDCVTNYQVIKEFKGYSLVKVLIETGKTHQIRVHFSHFSYPIVGDDLYNQKRYQVEQMLLFSYKISFHHPIKDQLVEVELDLPESFTHFMKKNGA
ncbi:MAG: RluA family pseudouridine synthase [Firmicutes bacterium]|nr:RluA family pseudouridine synthase [Bacillota bacterium]